jgi:hypothetical protein
MRKIVLRDRRRTSKNKKTRGPKKSLRPGRLLEAMGRVDRFPENSLLAHSETMTTMMTVAAVKTIRRATGMIGRTGTVIPDRG